MICQIQGKLTGAFKSECTPQQLQTHSITGTPISRQTEKNIWLRGNPPAAPRHPPLTRETKNLPVSGLI